jgi:hypothetical protein
VRRLVSCPRLAVLALALGPLAVPSLGRADEPPPRPKFQVALGLGASLDRNAPNPTPDRPITSFFFTAGLGDGGLGVDLRAFANGATAMQVTRLAVELIAVLRPLEPWQRGRDGYAPRVLRSASLDLGPSMERVSQSRFSDRRFGLMLGAHVDLPFTVAPTPSELRLRLGARHLRAATATVGDTPVTDTLLELYAQLAFVF